ncbi:MAG: type III-B CRISPR module-associated protein Cmr5 [Euryarchaeota archaeon]
MTATPFRWALECVKNLEELAERGTIEADDPLETYYKRATRAAIMVSEEGLPITLAFLASRGSKDPGTLLAYHLAAYINHVVLPEEEPDWPELRRECFDLPDDAEELRERVRDEVREALTELARREGPHEMPNIESQVLDLLNTVKRVAEGWHKIAKFGGD